VVTSCLTLSAVSITGVLSSSPTDGAQLNVHALRSSASNTTQTRTIFDDEFRGNVLSKSWDLVQGANSSNQELECYLPSHVSVSKGALREIATVGSTCSSACPPPSGTSCSYYSGAVQWRAFTFTYGTVSVRAKLAGGVGTWPAIWLLGRDCQKPSWITNSCNWPAPGANEIDIAEILNSNHTHVNQQLHTMDSNGNRYSPQCYPKTTNVSLNWHVYSLTWTSTSLTWMIDGRRTCQVNVRVPTTPMFLIINTAVGGIGAGRVAPVSFPQTSTIDYVRVSQPVA
jgi:beta-glucanase (GH16 family)